MNLDLSLTNDSAVKAIEWLQAETETCEGQSMLRLELTDLGGGAFFSLETKSKFYFDSAAELVTLAELVEVLQQRFTDADVF